MSANPLIFGICLPIDLIYLGVSAYWVYRDAQLTKVDESLRKLRRWVLVVTSCLNLWQIFLFWPWQKGKIGTHIPSEIALAGMLFFGYYVGYLWIGDWCMYYFSKFHRPFPNAVYYASGAAFMISGLAAALRSVVPFLLDDLWLYDLFFLIYTLPLVVGMGCCIKLAWDVRVLTKQRYIQVLNAANEEDQPLVNSSRRMHMCKVNGLIVYFAMGFVSIGIWVPVFVQNLATLKPGTPLHTRPEAPVVLVVVTCVSFWIPYALLLWYSKFEWGKDPLDMEAADSKPVGLDTMTKV